MNKQSSLVQRHLLTLSARSPAALGLFGLCGLLGCAHRSPAETDAQFRRLSQHEAALSRAEAERGQLIAQQASECAAPMRAATERVCSESEAVCALSDELRDRDAETRCLRARDACQAGREHVRVRCR